MAEDSLPRLAYALSVRALDLQERTLTELRARTGTVLAASSIVASFLGSRVLLSPGAHVLAVLGLSAFVGSVFAAVSVLSPRRTFRSSVSGRTLLESEFERRIEVPEMYEHLAY